MTASSEDTRFWEEVEEATEALHELEPYQAITLLRQVLQQSPRNPYAYHYLGVALYEVNELEAARDAYRAALRLAPAHLGARVHLSHVLRMLGDTKGALEQAQAAYAQAPNDPDCWHALGTICAQRGDVPEARRLLEAYLRSNPDFEVGLEVRAMLAALEQRAGRREE